MGVPHPDYLLPYLNSRQLQDWQQFHRQFNILPDRADVYSQMTLAMWSKDAKPEDFQVYNKVDRLEQDISQADFVDRIRSVIPI